MESKLVVAIILIVVSILAVTMVQAKGTPKEIPQKTTKINPNFSGDENSAYAIQEDETVGIQFSLAADALYVGIGCPSWNNDIGQLTLALYAFDTDYATSVSKDPIIKHTFEDYQDNSYLGFEFTEADPLKAGEYVIEITDAYDDTGTAINPGVGIWSHKPYPVTYFFDNCH